MSVISDRVNLIDKAWGRLHLNSRATWIDNLYNESGRIDEVGGRIWEVCSELQRVSADHWLSILIDNFELICTWITYHICEQTHVDVAAVCIQKLKDGGSAGYKSFFGKDFIWIPAENSLRGIK